MLKDSQGKTAEETASDQKTKEMFKSRLDLPLYRDQLKKRLSISKLRYKSPQKSLADLDSFEGQQGLEQQRLERQEQGQQQQHGDGDGAEPSDSNEPANKPSEAGEPAEVKMEGDKLE